MIFFNRRERGSRCLGRRSDGAPARELCGTCGVHVAARSPKAPSGIIIKVGTLDNPGLFDGPSIIVWTEEKRDFHLLPEGARTFPRVPGR